MSLGFLNKVLPVGWHLVRSKNCTSWTNIEASGATDALVRVDVKLVIPFVDALYGANLDTSAIFYADTWLGNHCKNVFHTSSLHFVCNVVFDFGQAKLARSLAKRIQTQAGRTSTLLELAKIW
jgi:hypothetical protein